MSEVKDPATIKLFGRTILLPLTREVSANDSSRPSSSSSPREREAEVSSRKEFTSAPDDDAASHQSTEDLKSSTTSSSANFENLKSPSAERETYLLKSSTNGERSEACEKTPKKPQKILPCPRCNSMDTKFCYYNNYKVNQPRHFCKNCQRYWTDGGSMRNVPVGAGRRRNKNSSASNYRHLMVPEALQPAKLNAPNNGLHNAVMGNGSAVFNFGPSHHSPLCDSMASKKQNGIPKGFHAPQQNTCVSYRSIAVSATVSSSRRPYPWNSAQWNCAVPPFCTTPAYWGRNRIPCISPQSSGNHSVSSSAPPNSPTLGKHSRDGNMLIQAKTLRIDDPSEAATSSIWRSTLGIDNEKAISLNGRGRGLSKAYPSNGNYKNQMVEASPVLHANPAALSRSLTFHEQT